MLQVIRGEDFSDLIIVATRYFPGCSASAPTRAYRACAGFLAEAERILRTAVLSLTVQASWGC